MKKLFSLLLAALLIVTCGAALADPIKVGIVTPDADHGFTGESVAHARAEIEAQLAALGAENLEYKFGVGAEPGIQIAAIEDILTWNPDVFVLWPNEGEALRATAESIIASGAKLIVYDRLIEGLQGFDAEIMGDNVSIGEAMGNYMIEYFKERLEAGEVLQYLLFIGDSSTVSVQRTEGMLSSINASPYAAQFVQVQQSFQTDWSNAKSQEQLEGWLNTSAAEAIADLDLIVTHDDEIVDGLMNALSVFQGEQNIKLITSVGGRRETLATFDDPARSLGVDLVTYFFSPSYIREAIRLAIADAKGEQYQGQDIAGQQFLIPSIEIDKDSVEAYRGSQEYIDRYSLGE
ncbi:MAG: substrate-binding domain-containing protein [Oscillospiraceae bacterium]|nr:substrate-binding domain-containing protein [Oscillospiraceae bacterium]